MEPVAWRIRIVQGQGPSDLSPNPQIVQVSDSVFWTNETSVSHRPAPDSGGEWFIERDANGNPVNGPDGQPIPKNIEPGTSSDQAQLSSAGPLTYHCALHPKNDREKGTIIVPAQQIQIRRDNSGAMQYDACTVAPGSYVTWLNVDYQGESHQPTFAVGPPTAPPIASTDSSAPVLFSTAGTFPYTCKIHPNDATDRGSITVQAPSQT